MRTIVVAVLLSCLLAIQGCGASSVNRQLAKFADDNIQKATMLYTVFVALNRYTGPANAEELKEFFATNEKAQKGLRNLGMSASNIDEYLVSPRDNEPYEFRWSAKISPVAGPYPVAFETVGVDGIRLVGFAGGEIIEVDNEEEYQDLLAGKHSKKNPEEQRREDEGL